MTSLTSSLNAANRSADATPGAAVDALLGDLRSQLRRAIAARAAWSMVAVGAFALWFSVALDRLFEPPPVMRAVVLAAAGALALIWLVAIAAPRILRRISDETLTTLLHHDHAREANLIGASLDLRRGDPATSNPLHRATLAAADVAAASLGEVRLVRPTDGFGFVWFACVALSAAVLFAVACPELAATAARRVALSPEPWPRRVELRVEGFRYDDAAAEWIGVFARGEPAEVLVTATVPAGQAPPRAVWSRGGISGGRRSLTSFTRVGQALVGEGTTQLYRRRLERVDEDHRLTIRGGDAALRLRLVAADRPRLGELTVRCTPPDYLDRPPYESNIATLSALPEGSSVEVRATTSKPLASASASLRAASEPIGEPINAEVLNEETIRMSLPPLSEAATLSVTIRDADGLESEPLDTPLEIAADTPPSARLALAGIGGAITRDARLPVSVTADDDHAIDAAAVWIDHEERSSRLPLPPPRTLPGTTDGYVDLLSLRSAPARDRLVLQPGDRVRLTAVVSDRYDLGDREPTMSPPIELEVVTRAELLARLGDAQRDLRQVIDGLLSDTQRLRYQLDLRLRRLTDSEADADQQVARWAAERRLDTRKIADGVTEAARRASGLADQVENNRVDQPALRDRLASAVARPLARIADRELATVRESLEPTAATPPGAALSAALAAAGRAEATLERVAASLDSQQTYNEVVALLRGLIREQRSVNQRTSRQKAQAVRDLFD